MDDRKTIKGAGVSLANQEVQEQDSARIGVTASLNSIKDSGDILRNEARAEKDDGSLILSWRIFPPPTAGPRRSKKKKKKKSEKKQAQTPTGSGQGGILPRTKETGGNDQQQDHSERGKELWRQKQQQYQYTYPYRVGEIVRILAPTKKGQKWFLGKDGEPKKKIQKLSNDDVHSTNLEGIRDREQKSQASANQNNHLVPEFARVEKIIEKEDEGHETRLKITRMNDGQSIILTPKEQRKLLCPDLDLACSKPSTRRTCAVVLVEETLPFRHVVRLHLDNKNNRGCDRVLEIGCSAGELSKVIWRNHLEGPCPKAGQEGGPSWVGMDHSQEMIDRCQEHLDQHKVANPRASSYASKLVKVDALDEPNRASKEATTPSEVFGPSPTVVLIDIGGNRECGPVVKTINWVFDTFGKSNDLRMVIVKSRALVRQLQCDADTDAIDNEKNKSSETHGTINVNKDIPSLDVSTGMVSGGTKWFTATHKRLQEAKRNRFELRFKHPLKAPKVFSPIDATTPICRYHNYHKDGCKLFNDRKTLGTSCPLDHDYCHSCLQKGHVAKSCPNRETQSCY